MASSARRPNASTSSRAGQIVAAPLRGTASSTLSGSMPRSNRRSICRVDARLAEPALQQRNDAERRQVALVEHDGVAERDRTGVVRVGIQEVEQPARSLAVALIPVDEPLAIDRNGGDSRGHGFPFQRARAFMSFDAGTGLIGFRPQVAGRRRQTTSRAAYPHQQRKASPTDVGLASACWGVCLLTTASRSRNHLHVADVQRRRARRTVAPPGRPSRLVLVGLVADRADRLRP